MSESTYAETLKQSIAVCRERIPDLLEDQQFYLCLQVVCSAAESKNNHFKNKGWVNIYKQGTRLLVSPDIISNENGAINIGTGNDDYVATVPIEW